MSLRFGYWLPVFGGWLRNVDDEGMSATWPYVRDLAVRSERIGFDLTLVAGLLLAFERAGLDFVLLQFSPQAEEMERFAERVIPLVREARAEAVA